MAIVSLNNIIEDIIKIVRGSQVANTEPISKRQIEEWVHHYRAYLLRRNIDKGKVINPDYIQEISYVELEEVPIGGSDVVDSNLLTDNVLFKSKLQIPKTIDFSNRSGIISVETPYGKEIQMIPKGRGIWQKYRSFTGNDTVCFLNNDYIYVVNPNGLQYVTIRGIFEIPPEVGRFVNSNTNQPYFNYDSKYPLPNHLIPVVKQMILAQELKIEMVAPSDNTNDSEHNLSKQ